MLNKLPRGHISPFKSHPVLSMDNCLNKKLKSLYRANIGNKRYPNGIVVAYIFDTVINSKKRFNKPWLSLENVYDNYVYFNKMYQVSIKYDLTISQILSEVHWMVDHDLYPYQYNKKLGVKIPDLSELDIAFSFMINKNVVIKDSLINNSLVANWQRLLYKNKIDINQLYDENFNSLTLRSSSHLDLNLVDQINKLGDLSIDDKRYLIYLIYKYSNCCYLNTNLLDIFTNNGHNRDELKIIGEHFGTWINFNNVSPEIEVKYLIDR